MKDILATDRLMTSERMGHETIHIKSWLVCFAAALFFFYEFIQMNMFNAISPYLMQSFSLNATQLGALSANYFYSNLIFLFPAGLILDRFSTRKIILTAMFICVFGTFMFALATNVYLAQVFRFLTGIGSAFCFLSCIRLATRWFPSRRMALVSGLIVTMAMIGGTVAQTPFTKLTAMLGWRDAVMIDAALGVIIIGIIWTFVTDYPPGYQQNMEQDKANISAIGFWRSLRVSYLNLQNWLCGIYTSMMNLPISLLGALWGGLYLQQVHKFSATDASFITSMIFVGTIIGSPLAGWISDHLSLRRMPMIIGALLALCVIALIMYLPFHSIATLMALFFILGLVTSTQVISYPTVAESNSRLFTASSVSVVSFTTISGYAISQPLFGYLMDLHWNHLVTHRQAIYTNHDFHTAMLILPVGFFIAMIATLFIRETHCQQHEKG